MSLLAGMLSRIVWVILQLVGRDSPLDYYRLISAGVGCSIPKYITTGDDASQVAADDNRFAYFAKMNLQELLLSGNGK